MVLSLSHSLSFIMERLYEEMADADERPQRKMADKRWWKSCHAVAIAAAAALTTLALLVRATNTTPNAQSSSLEFALLASQPPPHTGEYCSSKAGAAVYTKATLKRLVDRPVVGLLPYNQGGLEAKYEASDVIRVGEEFLVVCDSSWKILKISDSLPLLAHENVAIGPDSSFTPDADDESGFEAIMHDVTSMAVSGDDDYYVVRESVEHESVVHAQHADATTVFDAQILKVHFHGPAYNVAESCHSEFKFEGDSKGFEGAVCFT